MNRAQRVNAIQNLLSNVVNNQSYFVDAKALIPALEAMLEDMRERYTPEELNPNSEHYNPLKRIIQS